MEAAMQFPHLGGEDVVGSVHGEAWGYRADG